MENLSSDHHMQVIKFLKFFRSKRDLSLDQIQADFDDTQSAQLNEDMYTKDEVRWRNRGRRSDKSVLRVCVQLTSQPSPSHLPVPPFFPSLAG